MLDYQSTPTLIYDSEFDIAAIRENKPYRNIGQLLMSARSVRNALRLCGAEEHVLNGSASDYECFTAICSSMEYLTGHPIRDGIDSLVSTVFGICEELSPYNCEELWSALNAILEECQYTPTALLAALGVESLSVRVSPFEKFDIASSDIDIYAFTDLGDIVSLVASEANNESDLESFIKGIASSVADRAERGSYGVHITLECDYEFERMSRKHEIYDIYSSLKSGKTVSKTAQNGLKTYVLTSLFGAFSTLNLNIIADMLCPETEARRLLEYLALNKNLPTSILFRDKAPKDILPLALEFSSRNDYGLPSVTALCPDISKLCRYFPIGLCLEYQNSITDIISVASLISSRDTLPAELAFDLCYGNIKNRMRI